MTGREPIEWPGSGPPRSTAFGDLYYSAQDGLAEARQVLLAGCGLPDAWRDRRAYCVGELGFGTGLNIAALLDLWARERPADAHLSIFSVEAFPVQAVDAARSLSAWPELGNIADALTSRWPGRARGFHRVDLPQLNATLDLAVMEAADALEAWSGAADAWFLDGFSPAKNPQMWRPEVLRAVAARSAPGAGLATFTVAGAVRRGLADAGFEVAKRQGHGAKRERLEARLPGAAPPAAHRPSVAVIGAGIAGASLVRAFAAQGVDAQLVTSDAPAASAGPAALVTPRLDAGLGPQAALFAQAFARARSIYTESPANIIATGAVQLATGPKDEARFGAIASSDLFDDREVSFLTPAEASRRVGEAVAAGLTIEGALVVDPGSLLAVGETMRATVAGVERAGAVWRLMDDAGRVVIEADIVCVAAGMASARLVSDLALKPVRGQASFAAGVGPVQTTLFGGYIAPAPGGVVFGATHDRDDEDLAPRAEDHRRNLANLAAVLPEIARALEGRPLEARVGVRATTSDYLPLAGAAASAGLFVLTGLGSRGFTLAPLLAEHIAAQALGRPSPLPGPLAALVDPARFAARARRRGRQ